MLEEISNMIIKNDLLMLIIQQNRLNDCVWTNVTLKISEDDVDKEQIIEVIHSSYINR